MILKWEIGYAEDFSGAWEECAGPGWELCVQRDYNEWGFSVWVTLPGEDAEPVGVFPSREEAREVGEAIIEQWLAEQVWC